MFVHSVPGAAVMELAMILDSVLQILVAGSGDYLIPPGLVILII